MARMFVSARHAWLAQLSEREGREEPPGQKHWAVR